VRILLLVTALAGTFPVDGFARQNPPAAPTPVAPSATTAQPVAAPGRPALIAL
jgi:hypothetical protein